MNYCPNCGTKIESFWNVCANCGYIISKELSSTIIQKKPENKVRQTETVVPKQSYAYFKPQKTYGTFALTFGIIGFGLSVLSIILSSSLFFATPISLVINGFFIVILGILAIIFGFVGVFKDDSRGIAVAGLILGAGIFGLLFIRFILFIRYSFYLYD
jgi:hypothetical protein